MGCGGGSRWDPLIEQLTASGPSRSDAPGIGGTDLPCSRDPAGAGRFSAGVSTRSGVPRAHVLGVSFGGLSPSRCRRSRTRVDRLVLASTTSGVLCVPASRRPDALLAPWSFNLGQADAASLLAPSFGATRPAGRLGLRGPWRLPTYLNRLGPLGGCLVRGIRPPAVAVTGDDDPIVPASNSRILACLQTRGCTSCAAAGTSSCSTVRPRSRR
jgi:hypothetical protein